MGEYATRDDGVSIKIGTCETMNALRYEDRNKVVREENSLNPADCMNLFWRLPFPDEDDVLIGEYRDCNRGYRLGKSTPNHNGWNDWDNWVDESLVEFPGRIQLRHEASGLQASIICYHGIKLPEDSESARFGWNGKGHSLELIHVKNMKDGIFPVVQCRHCNKMWRYAWEDIIESVADTELRKRLEKHMK